MNREKRTAYRILVGEPEGMGPLWRSRRRWKNNIKMDLREIGWGSMYWIDLSSGGDEWSGVVNTVMNFLVIPSMLEIFLETERLAASQERLGSVELLSHSYGK
jgi:hypothetical protein